MANTVLIDNKLLGVEDSITTLYTSPSTGSGTIITAFTVTNNTTASASYKAYIYDGGGSSVGAIQPFKVLNRDRFDSVASAVNHVIPAGGTIRAENNIANSLNFYASGLEQ